MHRVIFPHANLNQNRHLEDRPPQTEKENGNGNGVKNADADADADADAKRPGAQSRDRYSMTYFCHPNDETRLEAVPSRLIPPLAGNGQRVGYGGGAEDEDEEERQGTKRGRVLTAREHLKRRLDATYNFVHGKG